MTFAYWIIKAKRTQSEYVMLIASLMQQWLHGGVDDNMTHDFCILDN